MAVEPIVLSCILTRLGEMGVDAERVARSAGLELHRLPKSVARSDDARLAKIWVLARRQLARNTLPIEVGSSLPLGVFGAIDYLASSAATLADALTLTSQFLSTVAPGVQLLIEKQAKTITISIINQPPFAGQDESDQLIAAILVERLQIFSARKVCPKSIRFAFAEPDNVKQWLPFLGQARLMFGTKVSQLVFENQRWNEPSTHADHRLHATLQALVQGPASGEDALLTALRVAIRARLNSSLSLNSLGKVVALSPRTLQRRLQQLGTNVAEQIDLVRRLEAERLVESTTLPLSQVAERLGYESQSAFVRAFRRWRDNTPLQVRKAANVAPPISKT